MDLRRFSTLPVIVVLTLVYFGAGKLGLSLASLHASASPVWPPAGMGGGAIFSAFLAALGGVIGGAFLGIYPGLDFEMLPIAFAVVIIGGMGSLGGAAIGALMVGLADNFGKALFPEISYFTLYAPMALILAVKPTGLFGRE